jgi:hypothetical protein
MWTKILITSFFTGFILSDFLFYILQEKDFEKYTDWKELK